MNKTVIMLMGRSGSGKTTLQDRLIQYRPQMFHKVVSTTTRPKREGEQHGVDYYFVNEDEWNKLDSAGKLIQKMTFGGHFYGSTTPEYETKHPFALLAVIPSSAKTFTPILKRKYPNIDLKFVFFNITNERLQINMVTRGDEWDQIDKRLAVDDIHRQFQRSLIVPDYIVNDTDLDDNLYLRFFNWLLPENERVVTTTQAGGNG